MRKLKCEVCDGTGEVPDQRELGAALRKLRDNSGLTLRVVAEELGFSVGYLCDLEHGRRRWPPELVQRYRKAVL